MIGFTAAVVVGAAVVGEGAMVVGAADVCVGTEVGPVEVVGAGVALEQAARVRMLIRMTGRSKANNFFIIFVPLLLLYF